jgi:hypothetical protein
VNDYIEIGAFAKPCRRQKIRQNIAPPAGAHQPAERQHGLRSSWTKNHDNAGVDPFSLLVDRNPEDNLKEL